MRTLFVTVSHSSGSLVLEKYDGKHGCYVCAIPNDTSKKILADLARKLGNIDHDELKEKLHATVIYSKRAPKILPKFDRTKIRYEGICSKVESMVGHDKRIYIYAAINSNPLRKLNSIFTEAGAKHTFSKYNCHITLDKYSVEEWKTSGDKVKEKLAELNEQLKSNRLVLAFTEIKVANLKD